MTMRCGGARWWIDTEEESFNLPSQRGNLKRGIMEGKIAGKREAKGRVLIVEKKKHDPSI